MAGAGPRRDEGMHVAYMMTIFNCLTAPRVPDMCTREVAQAQTAPAGATRVIWARLLLTVTTCCR